MPFPLFSIPFAGWLKMIPRKSTVLAFSIIEVMVALGILSVGAFVAYDHFLTSQKVGLRQLSRVTAGYLAQQELEQLRACPYGQLKAWRPSPMPIPVPNHLQFVYLDQVEPRPDGLLELTVSVAWDMLGSQKFTPGNSITLKGLKAP